MPFRILASCAVLSFLSLYHVLNNADNLHVGGPPDFSQYRPLQVLSKDEFPFDDSSRRVILVGDIHGQYDHFQTLLTRLSYDNKTDTLLHLGDIVTKGSLHGSLDVLSFMSSNGIQGVRGNQDQKVVEWHGWITWVVSRPGGAEFLQTARDSWEKAKKKGDTLKSWNKQQRRRASEKAYGSLSEEALMDKNSAKWWQYVPSDWTLFSDPYMIASEMTERHYEYLISLPVRIHVPHAHLFLVHAGLLSHDPKHDYDDPRQPLGHVPTASRIYAYGNRINALRDALNPLTGWMARLVLQDEDSYRGDVAENIMREQQERAILDLPLNKDPWVSLNLRSVKHGKPSRGNNKGTPWSEIWNADMDMCHGFDTPRDAVDPSIGVMKKHRELPCLPMSVIYGHAAARRLDIKRWSFGLDTGCVKKRQLTALVHGGTHDDGDELIAFGDASQARIVSVNCKA